MSQQKQAGETPSVHRAVLRRFIRFAKDYGGIPLLVGIAGVAVGIFIYCLWIGFASVEKWTSSIADPTERGLAYVAVSILLHSFLRKSNVDVKVDSKRP